MNQYYISTKKSFSGVRKILLLIQRKGALDEFLFTFHKIWFYNIYYEHKVALDRIFGVVKRRKYHCWYFRHFFYRFSALFKVIFVSILSSVLSFFSANAVTGSEVTASTTAAASVIHFLFFMQILL